MPHRTLRFCPTCAETQQAAAREACRVCGTELLMLLDDDGALTREFLTARGTCCTTGCRNCPYPADGATPTTTPCVTNTVKSKTCDKCGGTFQCHAQACWCNQVQLSDATLKWLARTYSDCLCPQCLHEFSVA